jgi:hypothetical protein
MKYALLIFAAALFCSCSDSFINHKLQYEKLGACSNEEVPVKMLSNIAGEQYELVSCIDDNFDGKNYSVERKGDTIIVDFPKTASAKAAFKLTLDIDAKPVYHYIIIDGHEIPIVQRQF